MTAPIKTIAHKPLVERFSKPMGEYLRTKQAFFDAQENRRWLATEDGVRTAYLAQPPRKQCVVCKAGLLPGQFFLRGIGYSLCPDCGHFNGDHEDTEAFAEQLYQAGHGEASRVYGDTSRPEYDRRVEGIYLPKVEFLVDVLKADGQDPRHLSYADLGSGGGHFVAAMRRAGLDRSIGYETSAELVGSANVLWGSELMRQNPSKDLERIAATIDCDVLTMVFALEHVAGLRSFVDAVRRNPRIRYFFFAVPMLTPSVFLEGVFANLMPRTLGLGHTHLFTTASLERLCAEGGLERLGAWWFGGNAFDLHRFARMSLSMEPDRAAASAEWDAMMAPMLDELQAVFDKHRLSSEVHLVTKVQRGDA